MISLKKNQTIITLTKLCQLLLINLFDKKQEKVAEEIKQRQSRNIQPVFYL